MTRKKLYPLLQCLALLITLGAGSIITACNSKDDDVTSSTSSTTTAESVAVTAFSLTGDLRVMKNLDSVFFSIDLEHGVIFNADSLPKGTNVTKLVPVISYPNTVTSATIEMKGGTHREDGVVNYMTNPTDTIDFTGTVTLTLGANKNALIKQYTLKVNVHQEDPDTMYWDTMASASLPSRLANPAEQKTASTSDEVYCLVKESDSSYTLSRTTDLFKGEWTKSTFTAFEPDVRSFTASTEGTLYALSTDGSLMMSADGASWNAVATGWKGIIGLYGSTLLGFKGTSGNLTQTCYPAGAVAESALPQGFPEAGFTSPIKFSNRWTPDPTIVIFGGTPFGSSSPAWAFDGSQWAEISETPLPALSGLTVVDYYSYLNSASNSLLKEFEVYLAFGGRDSSGIVNRTVYISYDHGINWQRAQDYMQLPLSFSIGYDLDGLTAGLAMDSNLSDRWNIAARGRRLPYEVEGDLVKWQCPYIFLFGGHNASGSLINSIRSGVLQRLTFTPLF